MLPNHDTLRGVPFPSATKVMHLHLRLTEQKYTEMGPHHVLFLKSHSDSQELPKTNENLRNSTISGTTV